MRPLTITRNKKFAGSMMPIKFYIEDPEAGDTDIKGVHTRKLLELKNGESKTVEIGEGATKIFAIADQASKDWCVDVKQIPEGTEPVTISGMNKANLFSGNAFRFDGNETDPYAQAVRSGGKRKGTAIMIGAIAFGLIVGLLVGFFIIRSGKPKAKTFTKSGLSITLTDQFKESTEEPFTAVYLNDKQGVAVMTSKETVPAVYNLTLTQYANLLIEASGQTVKNSGLQGDKYVFEYEFTNPDNKITYYYRVYIYNPAANDFWVVDFSTPVELWEKRVSSIDKWAGTIEFGK